MKDKCVKCQDPNWKQFDEDGISIIYRGIAKKKIITFCWNHIKEMYPERAYAGLIFKHLE